MIHPTWQISNCASRLSVIIGFVSLFSFLIEKDEFIVNNSSRLRLSVRASVTSVKTRMHEFVVERSQMPQQVALYVKAFFTVGTEKRLFTRVRSLMYHH